MDYEKKYNEALERAKAYHRNELAGTRKEMTEYIFPELAESEDERIRKGLVRLLTVAGEAYVFKSTGIKKDSYLAYLEKQKEQKPNFDTHWENGSMVYEQKEQKFAEWKPQPESLEALMYAIEGKWEMIKPTSYLSRRLEDLYEGLVNTYNVDETYLAELPKTAYTAKDIEELRALKDKIDASMDEKPAEWSEEDKKMLNELITIMDGGIVTSGTYLSEYAAWLKSLRPVKQEWDAHDKAAVTCIACCLDGQFVTEAARKQTLEWFNKHRRDFLNSTSWKPSEEQMEALRRAVNKLAKSDVADSVRLSIMFDNLKKLM